MSADAWLRPTSAARLDVDGRDKPGYDGAEAQGSSEFYPAASPSTLRVPPRPAVELPQRFCFAAAEIVRAHVLVGRFAGGFSVHPTRRAAPAPLGRRSGRFAAATCACSKTPGLVLDIGLAGHRIVGQRQFHRLQPLIVAGARLPRIRDWRRPRASAFRGPSTLRAARPIVWISEVSLRRKAFLVGVEDGDQAAFGNVEALRAAG